MQTLTEPIIQKNVVQIQDVRDQPNHMVIDDDFFPHRTYIEDITDPSTEE